MLRETWCDWGMGFVGTRCKRRLQWKAGTMVRNPNFNFGAVRAFERGT